MERRSCSTFCSWTVTLFLLQGLCVTTHSFALRTRTARSTPACPAEWDEFGNKCYRIFGGSDASERETWTEANSRCTAIGSTLVSIHSLEEQAYLSRYVSRVKSDIWIGLYLLPLHKNFQWTDDSPLDFSYWEEGEPNYYNDEEECVHMNYVGSAVGKWNDHRCARVFPYICQLSKGTCGGDITAENGIISSPNYPNRYEPRTECIWNITVPEDYQVSLRFRSFRVEEQQNCNFDYVKILDGHEPSSPTLGKFCGTDDPGVILSSGNKMSITFKSDASYQLEGFTAEFQKDTAAAVELKNLLLQVPSVIVQPPKIRRPKKLV